MTEYRCMTPEEYALWADQPARARTDSPCYDCPAWFAAEAGDRCMKVVLGLQKRGARGYSPEEVREARRRTWRDSKRRARARSNGYNETVGSSDTSASATMPSAPFRSLTLLSGVAASRGQD